jgi:hypothetical protein
MYKKILFLVFVLPMSLSVFSQYHYNAGYAVVYNILNTKCSNAGCHSAASASTLRFDTTAAAVYAEIFNQPPVNIAAQQRGEQLVWMDQPYQSYLLKKAGSWFDTDLGLPIGESDSAAHSQASTGLTNIQVEYIRQWIMDSAAQVTNNIDTTIINAYYTDTAAGPFSPKLPQLPSGTGIQLRYGPFFLRNTAGNNQVEYLLMNQVNFPKDQEAYDMNLQMTSFSHHFILFTYDDSASAFAKATGLREVTLSLGNTVSPFDGNKSVCSVWVYSQDITLPNQTAFFWNKTTYFDLDFHMLNYSTYDILPFDVYVNLKTRARVLTDSTIQMQSRLNNNTTLGTYDVYPPYNYNSIAAHSTSVCIDEDQDNGSGASGSRSGNDSIRYIWMINSHTHKMGVGFNIMTFKPDPNQIQYIHMSNDFGPDTIYNGFLSYNSPQGVTNLGYYNWEHPPLEYFPNLLPINYKTSGLIAETTYQNDSSFDQTFGFTTAQEMQLFYYLYVTTVPPGLNVGVNNIPNSSFDFKVYPNPMAGRGAISYTLAESAQVNATVTDITGNVISVLKDEKEQSGNYSMDITNGKTLSAGMYFAKLTVNGQQYTKKFVVE